MAETFLGDNLTGKCQHCEEGIGCGEDCGCDLYTICRRCDIYVCSDCLVSYHFGCDPMSLKASEEPERENR